MESRRQTPLSNYVALRRVSDPPRQVTRNSRGLRSNPGLMLIDDADKAAKWYFALKAAPPHRPR